MLKITLTVDQDHGAELVGLLAKAYGRGELGIAELLIERPNERVATLRPVPAKTIAKLTGHSTYPAQATAAPKRRAPGLGSHGLKTGKPGSMAITLGAVKRNVSLATLKAMWAANGFKPNGIGATLSKLRKRGYVKREGEGVWRLTPKGEELEHKLNEKVEHDDSPHD